MSLDDLERKPGPVIICLDLERLIGILRLKLWHPKDLKHINYAHPDFHG